MERKYIWLNDSKETAYVEFQEEFEYTGGKAVLKITADYKYAAFVNGQFVGNSIFPDLPTYKTLSEYDVTKFLKAGKNVLRVKAYHMSDGRIQCKNMPACVSYEITTAEKSLVVSSEKTLCRKDPHYEIEQQFTWQLGEGYGYSIEEKEADWGNCKVINPNFIEVKKPIANTNLDVERECYIMAQGVYKENGGDTAAKIMQKAWLLSLPFSEMDGACAEKKVLPLTFQSKQMADGMFMMGDLGCECAGYPYFTVECEEDTTAYLGWGEHLTDLRLRTTIGQGKDKSMDNRNFAVKINLKKGSNRFDEYLRRIAGRYLCLYVGSTKNVTLRRFGLREELYPLKKPAKDFGDELLNKIYETGRRTLEVCMHEKYEDCPWREQGFYGLDSRNEMLFGYGAFEEYEYPRAMLSLIAKSLNKEDLVPLCIPMNFEKDIPSFSLYWILAVYENAKVCYDEKFIKEILPSVEKVIRRFIKNEKDGVLYSFNPKENHWNFYEWTEILNNVTEVCPDGVLTALFYRAIKRTVELEEQIGNVETSKEFRLIADRIAKNLHKFYNSEKKLFASVILDGQLRGYHELTQAVFMNTGTLTLEQRESVKRQLLRNNGELIKADLVSLPMKYEALLQEDKNTIAYVKKELCRIFGNMLFQGATSYWETQSGDVNFQGAGSLCHGWSAVACWVLDNYCKNLA